MSKHKHEHDKQEGASDQGAAPSREASRQETVDPGAMPQDVEALRQLAARREAEIESLKRSVAELQEKADALHRTAAELDNRRKRTDRQMEESSRYAVQHLVADLLPAIDNFERALEHAEGGRDFEALLAGVRLAREQVLAALCKHHVEKVAALGRPFDPAHHEAVIQLESAEHPDQTVIQVHQEGYRLRDRLIRPSRVVVSRRPAEQADQGQDRPQDAADKG